MAVTPVSPTLLRAFLVLLVLILPRMAAGQVPPDLEDRPIAEVRIEGLVRVEQALVENQLRATVGEPFRAETVRGDIRRLERLGQFEQVIPQVHTLADGSVAIVYALVEYPIIAEVQVVGNTVISDQELLGVVRLFRGLPRDDYLIENAKRSMSALYEERGYYLATVTVDEAELEDTGVLLFRIFEGPRVRIRSVVFQGNQAFSAKQLRSEITTRAAVFLIRKGQLDKDVLAEDDAALGRFYKDRGYRDVQVGHIIELSPDDTEAKVTFVIDEGVQYVLEAVQAVDIVTGGPLKVFAPEQIAALVEIRPGDVYSEDLVRKSRLAVVEAYERLGYLSNRPADQRVVARVIRSGPDPRVILRMEIDEGRRYRVGTVDINGNFLTRDKVIRRLVRLKPGRLFDGTEILRTEQRIRETRLFGEPVRITVQPPATNDSPYRDVLVEVKERNTGSVNFGVAVGSDSGVFGEFSLNQNNFDVTDTPESLEELLRGAAFRGAGQRFNMTLRPGSELFQYSVSLTEPHLFDSEYALQLSGSFRDRRFDVYDETRLGLGWRLSRRLGDVWDVGVQGRFERVELDEIELQAPTEIFRDRGPDTITSLGVSLVRTTVETIIRPDHGSRLELGLDRVGALGGDYGYFTASVDYTVFLAISEDFLGRRSTLKLNTRVAYAFGGDSPPVYEQYYLGGRSFRGFDFRTVSPKGIRAIDGRPSPDPVGGEWLVFAGAQYEFPLFEERISGVIFADSGTVLDKVGLDEYRVSIGAGVRLYIPQLGPVPIALDLAVPLVSEADDDEEIFSFSAELPF